MPTSSGPYYSRGSEKLLPRRDSAGRHTSSLYNSPTMPAYASSKHSYSTSRYDDSYTGSMKRLDINNNPVGTHKSYKASTYTSPTSSSITHYPSKTSTVSGHYTGSSSTLSSVSTRSNSVDCGQSVPRTHRSNPASQNYNYSCSSYDTDVSSVKGSSSLRESGNVGLTNLGNTCFMNSVLQCLINTKRLRDYVMSGKCSRDINRTTSSMKGALMEEYAKLIEKIWGSSPPASIAPRELKNKITKFAPRFGGYSQQDAQELLRYLLQGLHEDVNRVKVKPKYIGCDEEAEARMGSSIQLSVQLHVNGVWLWDSRSLLYQCSQLAGKTIALVFWVEQDKEKAAEYWRRYINFDDSAIVDLFVGQLKSELTCLTCGYKSVTFDPFWDLSLPIPKSSYEVDVMNCMESFMKEETLDGDESPTCADCKKHRKCTKRFKIQKFPKILVLHLKRFSGERYKQKLSTRVNFKLTGLNLEKFGVEATRSAEYNLYGISNHVGSVYSGHYTAYCKHPDTASWYSFNDSRVSDMSSRSLVSDEAYVLFYELAN